MTNATGTIVREDDETDGCEMEGCRGHLVLVQWADKTTTEECSSALHYITAKRVQPLTLTEVTP
jgi:hypothetical protein